MGEEAIQRGIQFPKELYDELSKIAKEKEISYAAIVREACIAYLDTSIPGHCHLCHNQNTLDAQFCQRCGCALSQEAQDRSYQSLDSLIETIRQMDERLQVLEKKIRQ